MKRKKIGLSTLKTNSILNKTKTIYTLFGTVLGEDTRNRFYEGIRKQKAETSIPDIIIANQPYHHFIQKDVHESIESVTLLLKEVIDVLIWRRSEEGHDFWRKKYSEIEANTSKYVVNDLTYKGESLWS